MSSRLSVMLLVSFAYLGAGPLRAGATEPAEEPEPRPGVVFVAGGIGGLDSVGRAAMHVFPRMGLPHEVHDFVWQHGTCRFLEDLQDTDYLVQRAAELAAPLPEL